MDENNKSSFFDKNTIMAIVLSLVFFMGWQTYMQKKYPESYQSKDKTKKSQTLEDHVGEKSEEGLISPSNSETVEEQTKKVLAVKKSEEQIIEISNDLWDGLLNTNGMGLEAVNLKKYSDRKNESIHFLSGLKNKGNFSTYYKGEPVFFNVEKKGDNHFVGTGQLGGQTILKEIILNPKNYTLQVSVKTLSGSVQKEDIVETKISNQVLKVKSSMFTPAYEGTEFFSISDGDEERERIDIDSEFKESLDKTVLTSIGSQYFAVALNDSSPMIPKTQLMYSPEEQMAYASIFHQPAANGSKLDIQFTGFVGPKKYDILKNLEPNFVTMINYGMFSILSKPMLRMLKWLYGMFKNWGLAIILLTIFIRLLLLPINVSSLKSMKKMQKIQPKLKALKEKYKNDPTRMNQETMALMKKEGANPLGGCLPMLLQLPVFFALYSVLGQSVELYKSPFVFWIKDLSYQDPYFVLPVAVGALYFIQMSITPQPTDATQAKVMKFIPILFCFFMITVPSGLTLYFFVNTVFGIGQSYIFQREKREATA